MSCELECDDLGGRSWEELFRSMLVKTEDGCFALRTTAEAGDGGGGGYTFPANHGNTAYVSSDGSDVSGAVGNISKPFATLQAAVDALDGGSAGQVIIISSSYQNILSEYDTSSTHPYNITIHDLTQLGIVLNGSSDYNFGAATITTNGNISIQSTGSTINVDDYLDIKCKTFAIPSTNEADFIHSGLIQCETFTINANTNNPALQFDRVIWTNSCNVNEPITYSMINPMVYRAILSQSGTSAPTATVIENTINETPTYSYFTDGINKVTSPGSKFIELKTFVHFNPIKQLSGGASFSSKFSTSVIELITLDEFGAAFNGPINGAELKIEIYP